MELSTQAVVSSARKLAMKILSILTLVVCSDCSKVIQKVFDLISDSEDQSKSSIN